MELGVISDTHIPERADYIPGTLVEFLKSVDLIIHAGDITSEKFYNQLQELNEIKAVAGNMDSRALKNSLPKKEVIDCNGYLIGITHGDQYMGDLKQKLNYEFSECDLIIFGHIHQPVNKKENNKYFFNPGSVTNPRSYPYPTYGRIIVGDKIEREIINI